MLLSSYFFILGIFALAHMVSPLILKLIPSAVPVIPFHLKFTQGEGEDMEIIMDYNFNTHDLAQEAIRGNIIASWGFILSGFSPVFSCVSFCFCCARMDFLWLFPYCGLLSMYWNFFLFLSLYSWLFSDADDESLQQSFLVSFCNHLNFFSIFPFWKIRAFY